MLLWEQTLHGNRCTDQWDVRDVQDAAQDVRDREWAGSPPIPVNSAIKNTFGGYRIHG